MNYFRVQSHFFLVFLVIGIIALVAIPFVKNTFLEASDTYVINQLHKAQVNLYFQDIDTYNVKNICYSNDVIFMNSDILLESGHVITCHFNEKEPSISFTAILQKHHGIYCVDSFGYQGYIESDFIQNGRCSK